jgi:hypothetical protein
MSSLIPEEQGTFAGDVSDHSSELSLVRRSDRSFVRNHKNLPVVGATPPPKLCLDYPRKQRSFFTTVADERVLRYNYDIPDSIFLHFSDKSTEMIDGPGDVCVYERMFLAGLRLPLPPIVRELLFSLGIAPAQLMPNGWRYFFFYLLIMAYSIPESDYVDPGVFEYLWAIHVSHLGDGDFPSSGEEPVHRPREQVFQQQRLGGAILLHFRELGSCRFGASSFEAFRSL